LAALFVSLVIGFYKLLKKWRAAFWRLSVETLVALPISLFLIFIPIAIPYQVLGYTLFALITARWMAILKRGRSASVQAGPA
jgi:hypothetical protein